ncbi:hypothetical protein ACLOJK_034139 [Asimina triloba]
MLFRYRYDTIQYELKDLMVAFGWLDACTVSKEFTFFKYCSYIQAEEIAVVSERDSKLRVTVLFLGTSNASALDYVTDILSKVRRKLMFKKLAWMYAYLVFVVDIGPESRSVEEIPVVREFPDVFPGELLGLPLERKVEFDINIRSGV